MRKKDDNFVCGQGTCHKCGQTFSVLNDSSSWHVCHISDEEYEKNRPKTAFELIEALEKRIKILEDKCNG